MYIEFIIICLVGLLTWLWRRSRRPNDYPPGPIPLPLIGNLLQMQGQVDFLKAVRIFREKYGNIFSLSLGKFWIIVVNEADTIRELLLKKGEYMLDRPPLYVFSFNAGYGKSICMSIFCLLICTVFSLMFSSYIVLSR